MPRISARRGSAACPGPVGRRQRPPPLLLGAHRPLAAAQHLERRLAAPCLDDAGAGAVEMAADAPRHRQPLDLLLEPAGPLARLLVRQPGEHDDELVAAQPGHQLARLGRRGQRLGERDDQLVALLEPQLVVDRLQPVHVDEQHPERRAGRSAAPAPRPAAGGCRRRSADRCAPGRRARNGRSARTAPATPARRTTAPAHARGATTTAPGGRGRACPARGRGRTAAR